MELKKIGSSGPEVADLQRALAAAGFPPGAADGSFGPGTDAAVRAFQRSSGLLADGVVGPATLARLGLAGGEPVDHTTSATPERVAPMFPGTPRRNIEANLPTVLAALREFHLTSRPIVLMALATIRAECAPFVPLKEGVSHYNTSPGGRPYDLYDNRRDIGNSGSPDGSLFPGRGYVQLTGRANYARYGVLLGLGGALLADPDLACRPDLAARLLARFIADKELRAKEALLAGDFRAARRLVNGGTIGIDDFRAAYEAGDRTFPT
jgi:putative chitinase